MDSHQQILCESPHKLDLQTHIRFQALFHIPNESYFLSSLQTPWYCNYHVMEKKKYSIGFISNRPSISPPSFIMVSSFDRYCCTRLSHSFRTLFYVRFLPELSIQIPSCNIITGNFMGVFSTCQTSVMELFAKIVNGLLFTFTDFNTSIHFEWQ